MFTDVFRTNTRLLADDVFELSWPRFPDAPAVIAAPDADEALRRASLHLVGCVIAELQAAGS